MLYFDHCCYFLPPTCSVFRSCISLSCPHLFRYVASCLILQKRLKHLMKDCPWGKSAQLLVIPCEDVAAGEGTEVKQFRKVPLFGKRTPFGSSSTSLLQVGFNVRGVIGMIRDALKSSQFWPLKAMPASSGRGGCRHKERQGSRIHGESIKGRHGGGRPRDLKHGRARPYFQGRVRHFHAC